MNNAHPLRLLPILLLPVLALAACGAGFGQEPASPESSPFPGARSSWQGYDRYDFVVDGCKTLVVQPKQTAPGAPWIWRAEFFDHRPETDIALVSRGFHLVYMDVGNTFGCPDAMAHWAVLYDLLITKHGLSKKPALEGLSRGGLYVYAWAAANPDKVSCIYGDNPVCDFKSWPGGRGSGPGSPDDWQALLRCYHFESDEQALAWEGNPVDTLKPLAEANIPLIHVCGDADEVVPHEENTALLKERYEGLGGQITVIIKKGFKHHPHGLDDPAPLVDFIIAHSPQAHVDNTPSAADTE